MMRRSGTWCTCTVASLMIPRRPSLPRTISRTLGPVEVVGTGRVTSVPAGVTTRTARVRSATSPYLSDCMPDERVAIQPPSVEWVKLSGKCPMVEPRRVVDLEHAVHAGHVDGDDRAVLAGRGLEAPGDVRAAPERDQDGVGVDGRAHDRLELRLAARADDDVGQAADVARAVADEVAQALAARVDDAVQGVGRHVGDADGRLQRGAQVGREGR